MLEPRPRRLVQPTPRITITITTAGAPSGEWAKTTVPLPPEPNRPATRSSVNTGTCPSATEPAFILEVSTERHLPETRSGQGSRGGGFADLHDRKSISPGPGDL